MILIPLIAAVFFCTAPLPTVGMGPPPRAGRGGGGSPGGARTQEDNPHFACPLSGQTAYTGTDAYKTDAPSAAPLRGNVGCVDMGPLASRPKGKAGRTVLDASNMNIKVCYYLKLKHDRVTLHYFKKPFEN